MILLKNYTHKVVKNGETILLSDDFNRAAAFAKYAKAKVQPILRVVK